jgi:hypothetical protein
VGLQAAKVTPSWEMLAHGNQVPGPLPNNIKDSGLTLSQTLSWSQVTVRVQAREGTKRIQLNSTSSTRELYEHVSGAEGRKGA